MQIKLVFVVFSIPQHEYMWTPKTSNKTQQDGDIKRQVLQGAESSCKKQLCSKTFHYRSVIQV